MPEKLPDSGIGVPPSSHPQMVSPPWEELHLTMLEIFHSRLSFTPGPGPQPIISKLSLVHLSPIHDAGRLSTLSPFARSSCCCSQSGRTTVSPITKENAGHQFLGRCSVKIEIDKGGGGETGLQYAWSHTNWGECVLCCAMYWLASSCPYVAHLQSSFWQWWRCLG